MKNTQIISFNSFHGEKKSLTSSDVVTQKIYTKKNTLSSYIRRWKYHIKTSETHITSYITNNFVQLFKQNYPVT